LAFHDSIPNRSPGKRLRTDDSLEISPLNVNPAGSDEAIRHNGRAAAGAARRHALDNL
jgi:hypothetical protein